MPSIVELVPSGLSLSPAVTHVLLELAYLVTAVDGKLTDEELRALGELAARLRRTAAAPADTSEVDALLQRFAHRVEPAEIEERVRALAPQIPEEHHELAYLLSLGLAFVDHDPHDAEDRFHAVLAEALAIPTERREALSRQVSLGGGRL
jgi:uncharacterized membrane protein YebE (DUF533 family)